MYRDIVWINLENYIVCNSDNIRLLASKARLLGGINFLNDNILGICSIVNEHKSDLVVISTNKGLNIHKYCSVFDNIFRYLFNIINYEFVLFLNEDTCFVPISSSRTNIDISLRDNIDIDLSFLGIRNIRLRNRINTLTIYDCSDIGSISFSNSVLDFSNCNNLVAYNSFSYRSYNKVIFSKNINICKCFVGCSIKELDFRNCSDIYIGNCFTGSLSDTKLVRINKNCSNKYILKICNCIKYNGGSVCID